MLRDLLLKAGVFALMLTAVAVAAHAQTTVLPGHCTGGPFTLTFGDVRFNVALDDRPLAPPMDVTLRLYDSAGNVVARRVVTVAAGQTATLAFRGTGLLLAQATFGSLLDRSDRRKAVGSVELLDVDNFRAIIPIDCVPNENIDR